MSMSKIKVGDTVRVIAGKEKGKEGKVLQIDHKKNRVTVEGVNVLTKHKKQDAQNPNGGIVRQEGSIDLSNVVYLYKGQPTKIGFIITDETGKNGKPVKKRVAKSTGDVID